MEVYHRDHLIITVHITTWNDLTKWNEENKIIEWINNVGMIVKSMLPWRSAFGAQAVRNIIYRAAITEDIINLGLIWSSDIPLTSLDFARLFRVDSGLFCQMSSVKTPYIAKVLQFNVPQFKKRQSNQY